MLNQMRDRFSVLLQPSHPEFNPLPAAACLLDPSVASFILGFDQAVLREAAKEYILTQVCLLLVVINLLMLFMIRSFFADCQLSIIMRNILRKQA